VQGENKFFLRLMKSSSLTQLVCHYISWG
jgi:hypothetical protein